MQLELKQHIASRTAIPRSSLVKKVQNCQSHTAKKSFSHSNNLSGHSGVSSRENMPRCGTCVKSFTHKRSAMRRFRGRERPFSCNVCNKCFTSHYDLDAHIGVHTAERPFSCKVRKNSFTNHSNLNRHLRVHSGEPPYSCNKCKKMFIRRYVLKMHLRSHSAE
jgi:KRAB domain-containing zinc finger protein